MSLNFLKTLNMNCKTIFVSGIDTDTGKTIATGLIALYFKKLGYKVITQKIVQTGCNKISEDIIKHREIMDEKLNDFDLQSITCPYIFNFPASPHLSSKLENKEINPNKILKATKELEKHFDYVIIEGIGGLCVPLNKNIILIDYIVANKYPLILVTSGKLGSINHTLLSLEAIKKRKIKLKAIIYNNYFSSDEIINSDSKSFLKKLIKKDFPDSQFIEIGNISNLSECKCFDNFEI